MKALIKGVGSQQLKVACGANVKLSASGHACLVVEGIFIRKAFCRLPDEVDSVDVLCDDGVQWSLEWFVPKPGHEVPDPVPIAIPVGAHRPESLQDTIARMVRHQVSQSAHAAGFDREEEEDFEDEDYDPPTPYEFEELGVREEIRQEGIRKLREFARKKRERAAAKSAAKEAPPPPIPAKPAVQEGSSSA